MTHIPELEKARRHNIKVEYQITFSRNGHILGITEWGCDLDAVCDLTDAVNQCVELRGKGYRAVVATRGS